MKSIKEICSFVKGEIFLKRDISFNRPVFWLLSEVSSPKIASFARAVYICPGARLEEGRKEDV